MYILLTAVGVESGRERQGEPGRAQESHRLARDDGVHHPTHAARENNLWKGGEQTLKGALQLTNSPL